MAYLDTLSIPPGDTLRIHASDASGCRTRVRRLIHSDPNPAGPGEISLPCDWGETSFSAPEHEPAEGSFGHIDHCFPETGPLTVSAWHYPTDLHQVSTIFGWYAGGFDWSVGMDLGLLTISNGEETASLGTRHRERQWFYIGFTIEPARSSGGLDQVTLFSGAWGRTGGPFLRTVGLNGACPPPASPLLIGARAANGRTTGSLDGRVAGLKIHRACLDVVQLMFEMNGEGSNASGSWDFSDRKHPDIVPARSTDVADMVLQHTPLRSGCVPGPTSDSKGALVGEGSVHFHTDDTEDCLWPVVSEITIPGTAESGFYSILLKDNDASFELPFVVSGRAAVTLLAPTLTWQAYSNLGRDPSSWPGRSHYELHSDGSPVCITTARKPSQTFAPSARLEVDAEDGFALGENATHLLMADLYAEHWLQEQVPHAVMDDRDLHFGGVEALDGVRVLVLSAHPEYWTAAMLDALEGYLSAGGSVIYLGGNGLYWVTSLHPDKPHLMEVRRWGGTQTCSVDPQDRSHQFDGCPGGLWVNAGRPPNTFVGVEFTGFGMGESLVYTRTGESYSPKWEWVFADVDSSTIGARSLNFGAGNEYDRVDTRRQASGTATVLARCEPTGGEFFSAYEQGAAVAPDEVVRADMAMIETPSGGLVFSLSSITASGCLPLTGSDNGLALVCGNVLRRMLED